MRIAVLGSVNLDLVARVAHLPRPGETVGEATLARHPGGKGANQALAARRLGAEVQLLAAVGADGAADEALALLRADGVALDWLQVAQATPTGIALIAVDAAGENQIVVAPGANATLALPEPAAFAGCDALIGVLEAPVPTVAAAVRAFPGFVALNLAPALPVSADVVARADLIIVNETELAAQGRALLGRAGLTALTLGGAGAELWQAGSRIAACAPPQVPVVDTVGAGDTFVAAITVALVAGLVPAAALRFACAASALAVTREGAQPSLPWRAEVDALVARTDW